MVLYLNDPAALDQLVQSLGQVVQAPPQTSGGSSQTAPIEAASAGNSTAATPNTAFLGAQTNSFAAQFQELQQSLAAIGAIASSPTLVQSQSRVAAAGFSYSGNALNVVA